MRRTAVACTAVALVLSTTAGCGSLQSSATEVGGERMTDDRPVRDGGTLTVALNADPDKLDPSLAQTLVGRTVFAGMCEKLYDVDEAGKVVPQLATALPKTSPDGRTVTFSVRKGLKFSDGTSLDAAAVVTSLLRHRDLPGSARATELAPLKAVEATGADTVKLTLKQAYVPLTAVLADRSGMVMSPAALKKYGKNFTNHPSCVGPFKFVERVGGDRIVLAKDPNYYDARDVHLDKVIYKPIPDGSVRLANLRSGDIQVGDQMGPVDVKSALTDDQAPALQLAVARLPGHRPQRRQRQGPRREAGQARQRRSPATSRVREAFELSIDRDTHQQGRLPGHVRARLRPDLPEVRASRPASRPRTAPSAMWPRRSGCSKAGGRQDPACTIELKTSTTPEDSRIGQVVQAMAKDAGFVVTLRPTEYATMLEETDDGHYDAFTSGWSGRLDPDGNIASFLQTKGAMNALRPLGRQDRRPHRARPHRGRPRRTRQDLRRADAARQRRARAHLPLPPEELRRRRAGRRGRTRLRRRPDPREGCGVRQ